MYRISDFSFDDTTPEAISGLELDAVRIGENWPVVYIINNEREAYVGETVHASRRAEQHLQNSERRRLTEIRIISDESFNKSVVLDLEAFIIKHMSSDGRFMLQNGNGGLQNHNYYHKSEYEREFTDIWNALISAGIADKTIEEIENSDLFKYSPYKSLGEEQHKVMMEIVKALSKYGDIEGRITVLVRGGAGTGKTILAVYLIKLFRDICDGKGKNIEPDGHLDDESENVYIADNVSRLSKMGIVLPQKSLQTALREVFRSVKGLDESMVLSPAEVVKNYIETGERYDLLLVDEAHRLKCRDKGHLANYRIFDECNRLLGLDRMRGNELDWLLMCSENQIFFRDELQTVRPCDIDAQKFTGRISPDEGDDFVETRLSTQWRCLGGNSYIDYINDILSCGDVEKKSIENYDVRLFYDIEKMIREIKERDREYGLCRVAAGYAWPWNTNPKNRKRDDVPDYDIEIEGNRYIWNSTYDNWISKENSINEIGCIHTVQGYDLNYAGIIIGEDLYFNRNKGIIEADKTKYYDRLGKSGVSDDPEALRDYLKNIYMTLLTRGIRGTYIYVCDDALREYFSRFFDAV